MTGLLTFPIAVFGLTVAGGALVGSRPKDSSLLSVALGFTLGQLLLWFYCGLRWILHSGLGPVSSYELWLVIAVLGLCGWRRGFWSKPWAKPMPPLADSLALALPWLFLYIAFFLRLPALETLSSDPDLHAHLLNGALQNGFLMAHYPQSSVILTYPSGFAALGFLWARLTGWSAVQAVNVLPFVQTFAFSSLLLALTLPHAAKRRRLAFCLLTGFILWAVLNPLWMLHRENHEGTARLVNIGILLLPWLAFWSYFPLRLNVVLTSATVVASAWLNPAHFPLACLWSAVAMLAQRSPLRCYGQVAAYSSIGIGFLLGTDPFYRWLVAKHLMSTPSAIGPTVVGQGMPGFDVLPWNLLPSALGLQVGGAGERLAYLVAALILAWSLRKHRLWFQWAKAYLVFLAVAQFVALVLHWVPAHSFEGNLLARYFLEGVLQVGRCSVGIWLAFALTHCQWRSRVAVAALVLVCGCIHQTQKNMRFFLPALKRTTLGPVTTDALELVERLSSHLPPGERLLLHCRTVKKGPEEWVMPEGASRAVGTSSSVPTAFYFGVDAPEFTYSNYLAHVDKLDLEWLRERGVRWALTENEDDPLLRIGAHVADQQGSVRLLRLP